VVTVPLPQLPHVRTPLQLLTLALRSSVVAPLCWATLVHWHVRSEPSESTQLVHEPPKSPLSSQPSVPFEFVMHELKFRIDDTNPWDSVSQFAARTTPACSSAMPHVAVNPVPMGDGPHLGVRTVAVVELDDGAVRRVGPRHVQAFVAARIHDVDEPAPGVLKGKDLIGGLRAIPELNFCAVRGPSVRDIEALVGARVVEPRCAAPNVADDEGLSAGGVARPLLHLRAVARACAARVEA
jgi:hypothetical protein